MPADGVLSWRSTITAINDAVAQASSAPNRSEGAKTPWTANDKANLRNGLLFISPWLVGTAAFVVFPVVYSLIVSLTKYSGMQAPSWVGLSNYTRMFQDPLFWTSSFNTGFYAGLGVPIGLVVALLLALAMNRNVREVGLYRTALYIPSLAPIFALSFIFIVLVNPETGLLPQFLQLFGVPPSDYFADPTTAKLVIVLMAQMGAGNAALIFLAGLNNVPKTLYESARIDGANSLQTFIRITLPLLSPAILFNLITGISGGLQVFEQAYIMTDGGPNHGTTFFMYYLYRNAFSYADLGYASALAIVLFLVGVALAVLTYQVSRRFVNYDATAA